MSTYKVDQRDRDYYVVGLPDDFGGHPDTMLLYRYPEGDCDRPYDAEKMHGALYDLFQTHDGLKEGDRFETPHGNFVCEGVHVVPEVSGHGRCR